MDRSDALLIGGVAVGLLLLSRRSPPQRVLNPVAPLRLWPRKQALALPSMQAVKAVPSPISPPHKPDALFDQHYSLQPIGGNFYPVGPDDTPESIARAVLEHLVVDYDEGHVLDYIYCLTSSPWNLGLYGSPSTSKRFPHKWIVPGFGKGIRAAFLPRNADAVAMMRAGTKPHRSVDEQAVALDDEDDEYGVLWLPPASADELRLGKVTCAPYSWEDGSSTINPDPELVEHLEAA